MAIEWWPITRPIPYAKNARKWSQSAIEKVAASIREFGWVQPIVCDAKDVIIIGHLRLEAAKFLKLDRVPVFVVLGKRLVRYIDLFAGAGGLSEGFRMASDDTIQYKSVFAVESDLAAAATYTANFGDHVLAGPIEKLKQEDLPRAELVIGGPPCQGFSSLGKFYPTDHHPRMNRLWRQYFRVIEWAKPRAFVIENVPEFLPSREFQEVERKAKKLGYIVDKRVLNAADFGVPQVRRRAFIIGVTKGEPPFPTPTTKNNPETVSKGIQKVAAKPLSYDDFCVKGDDGEYIAHVAKSLHFGRNPTERSLERYRLIPVGGNRFDLMRQRPDLTSTCWLNKKTGATDVMGRLEWGKPAVTIRTEFFKPEKGRYLHPDDHRPITHFEAALLQTFPETYMFCGSKSQIARQIGNAVPPKLAAAVAKELKLIFGPRSERSSARARGAAIGQLSLY
jgi:DNA (cytosine-5)-methyltransferase 1